METAKDLRKISDSVMSRCSDEYNVQDYVDHTVRRGMLEIAYYGATSYYLSFNDIPSRAAFKAFGIPYLESLGYVVDMNVNEGFYRIRW